MIRGDRKQTKGGSPLTLFMGFPGGRGGRRSKKTKRPKLRGKKKKVIAKKRKKKVQRVKKTGELGARGKRQNRERGGPKATKQQSWERVKREDQKPITSRPKKKERVKIPLAEWPGNRKEAKEGGVKLGGKEKI